ncbi:MAG TPA: glycosyltransferase family 9 protein [Planctomycetota bacterium]|nr:glycosyltransferase family 9 protein [Planctomycetota bacterium]
MPAFSPHAALPDRILIVRLGAIGDVVNALTVAAAIKDQNPAIQIGWMVHPLSEPLVRGNPVVDRVHAVPRKGLLQNLPALRRELRAEGYGLVIDLQRMQKSAILARQAGAARVLGYDRQRCKEGAWVWYNERIPSGSPRMHMVEQYAQFVRYLGIEQPIRHGLPAPSPADLDWLRRNLPGDAQKGAVVVHVGASKPENRWEPERYRDLVLGLLAKQDRWVLLTGGPGDRADALATETACASEPRFRSLVGATSLTQLTTLLGGAELFVGCDTGPMHLAAAQGVPVLALFGPADPLRTGPYGPQHRVLRFPPAPAVGPPNSATMAAVSSSDTLRVASEMLDLPRRET